MKISNSYPYPVLYKSNNDYSNSMFQVDYITSEEFGEVKIKAMFKLDNQGIEDLIQAEAAVFMLHIQCPQTSFRKVFRNSEPELYESIDSRHLRGKVFIHSYIIAQQEIPNYTNIFLNDFYIDLIFNFEKGNILAIGDAIELTLHEDDTELMDLPAIIDIHRAINNEFMEVDIHAQNIIISLPSYEYDQYASYSNTMLKNTIISMIILPTLTFVFSKLQENRGDLQDYTWYQVMEKIFNENNYRLEDVGTERLTSLKAAQLLLRKPIKSSFNEIEKINRLED